MKRLIEHAAYVSARQLFSMDEDTCWYCFTTAFCLAIILKYLINFAAEELYFGLIAVKSDFLEAKEMLQELQLPDTGKLRFSPLTRWTLARQ